MSELGERLREARTQRGVSQRALARRSGIGQASISRIERGLESPSFERFARLLSCLGLRPALDVEQIPYRGDRFHQRAVAELTISDRLEGAFDAIEFAGELRTAVGAGEQARER